MAWHFVFTVLDPFEASLTRFGRVDGPSRMIAEALNYREASAVLEYLRERQDETGWTMAGTENLKGLSRECVADQERVIAAMREIERKDDGHDGPGGVPSPVVGPAPSRPYSEAKARVA